MLALRVEPECRIFGLLVEERIMWRIKVAKHVVESLLLVAAGAALAQPAVENATAAAVKAAAAADKAASAADSAAKSVQELT